MKGLGFLGQVLRDASHDPSVSAAIALRWCIHTGLGLLFQTITWTLESPTQWVKTSPCPLSSPLRASLVFTLLGLRNHEMEEQEDVGLSQAVDHVWLYGFYFPNTWWEATEEEGDKCEKECTYCELETFLCTFYQHKSGPALKLELFYAISWILNRKVSYISGC